MSHSTEIATSKLKLMGGVALGLILFLVWIEGGFVSKTAPGTQDEPMPLKDPQTFSVSRQGNAGVVSWPARIEALKTIQVAPKISGRIIEIPVTAGTKVSRGQLLVRLENSELTAHLSQARAQLNAAEAGATRATADATRIRNLFGKEAATRQSLDAAIAEERQGHARVQEARSAVMQMETQLAEATLNAPYDGMVERRLREPGDIVMPGQPVLIFLQTSSLRIEASLPSTCAKDLQVGDTIVANAPNTDSSLSAIVEEKEPASDRETQTQRIKARLLTSPQGNLIPGSFVWLQQPCGDESMMLIPQHAIKRMGQLQSVTLLINGQPRLRHVRTGRSFGDTVEVISGLREGDQLLIGVP